MSDLFTSTQPLGWNFLQTVSRIARLPKNHVAAQRCIDLLLEKGAELSQQETTRFLMDFARIGAELIASLHEAEDTRTKLRLLELFVWKKRGRPRILPAKSASILYGIDMKKLWRDEVQHPWNMKQSLAGHARPEQIEVEMKRRGCGQDVVQAILRRKSTPDSVISRVYAQRRNISFGRVRNALREYCTSENWKPTAHL